MTPEINLQLLQTSRKRFLKIFIFPLVWLILTSSGGGSTPSWQKEEVSFPMMDIEINATMKENERQKEMRKNQTANAAVEALNKKQWTKFEEKVTKIQDRLRIVSLAIQAVPTGIAMSREVKKSNKTNPPLLKKSKLLLILLSPFCPRRCSLLMTYRWLPGSSLELLFPTEPSTRWRSQRERYSWIMPWAKSRHLAGIPPICL